MLISDIPLELLSHILSYIHDIYLLECLKVCKVWHEQVFARFYKDITLYDSPVRFLESTETNTKRIGDYVETLTFEPQEPLRNQILTNVQFAILISNLPNLRVIRFTNTQNLRIMRDYLYYFRTLAKYTKVQEVSIADFDYSNKKIKQIQRLHYLINFVIQDQITSLALYDTTVLTGSAHGLLRNLSRFKDLRHLQLNLTKSNLDFQQRIDTILEICPKLESLDLNSYDTWGETTADKVYPQLKTLNFPSLGFYQSHVEFFIHSVPNLLDLTFYVDKSVYEVYSALDTYTANQFIAYLKRLHHLKLCTNGSLDMSLFWNFVEQIYDPQFQCNLAMQFTQPHRQYPWHNIEVDKQISTFNINCEWPLPVDGVLEHDWAHHLAYFNFVSIRIDHCKQRDELFMRDLMQPVFLQPQQIPVVFLSDGSQVKFDENQCAYISYMTPQNTKDVLQIMGIYRPFTRKIQIDKCSLSEDRIVDLRQLSDLCELVFDVDLLLDYEEKNLPSLCIQLSNESKVDLFCYNRKQGSIKQVSNIEESAYLIKISCKKLEKFVFNRNRVALLAVDL